MQKKNNSIIFATTMAKEKKQHNQYRIIFYNDTNLQEETSFSITPLNIAAYIGGLFIIITFFVILLFLYTPLNSFLPSSKDKALKEQLAESSDKLDSVARILNQRQEYFMRIKLLMEGKDLETYTETEDTAILSRQKVDFTKSKHDSILRLLIEEEEAQTLAMINNQLENDKFKNLNFFMPVKGVITTKFDSEHLGIDIVAKEDEPILATLPGTVTLADWSLGTGNTIQIQHEDNIISIYKHNSTLLKKVGDKVKAGEPIAIIGNSGELTTGPHLHFELWHNGVAINPEDYIAY